MPVLPETLHGVPVFCVGDATAGKLRMAGFSRVESASGDADALFRLITARRLPGLHVMAVGERQGLGLFRQLREAGISVVRRTVYAARPLRTFPAGVAEALAEGEIGAALVLFSRNGASFYTFETRRDGGDRGVCAQPQNCCCAGWLALERDPCRISAD